MAVLQLQYSQTYMKKRKLRRTYNTPGDAHEFTWACYRRQSFFKNERTCKWLAEAIDKARVKYDFELWAYVIMPNHVHILIHPRRAIYDVSAIKQAIKQSVSQRAIGYLRRNNPKGLERMKVILRDTSVIYRFWQDGGGYDRNLFSPKALRAAIAYMHNNPVRRGLVESSLDWKWSSARAYEGLGHGKLKVDICDSLL
jgi:putative transposase